MWDFTCLSLEISIELFSFPFLFSGYFYSVDVYVVCIVSGGCNQSSGFLMNSSSFCIDASTLSWMLVSPLLLFLTQYSLSMSLRGVRPYASSLVFLFSGPFVEVPLSSSSEIVPSIWQGEQSRCLSLWWDFCYLVWFWVSSSFFCDTLF